MENRTLTALKGVKVGHSTHKDKLAGCTAVLFNKALPVGYSCYGGCPVTYNTDSLREGKMNFYRHGLFITGGSLSGLSCATEIIKEICKSKKGFRTGNQRMPSVSGAVVYDLGTFLGPYDPLYGAEAAQNATEKPVERGNVGAGTGTSVGKFSYEKGGLRLSMKSGVGSSRIDLGNGIMVCALSVVNAVGNVILPNGKILAGNRDTKTGQFRKFEKESYSAGTNSNTTVSIVGLNIDLQTRENYDKVAQIASHGQVRAIKPLNTFRDGDTVFAFSTGKIKRRRFKGPATAAWSGEYGHYLMLDAVAQAAADAVQESIYDACIKAESIRFEGAFRKVVPSYKDY